MISQTDIDGVIFNHETTENANNITKELDIALQSLGAKRYAYFYSGSFDDRPNIITNLPDEWLSEYEENYLYNVDPVLDISKKTVLPFSWMTQGLNKNNNNQLAANALKYKIVKGHTFISISHNNDIGVLTVCADKKDLHLDSIVESHKAEIQFALLRHHENYVKQYKQIRNTKKNEQIKRLSWREKEVINWIGCGKTYSETAIILGISERTIKFHVANIKNKLDVYSSRQVISIASKHGLIGKS
ncbi:autoinducer binding domain-containing protein [Halomonas sp. 5021]|uniref:helix-turn-helix transcriptional regulator n=1 Tax=Halomonas sp. 5021 TaxID=3082156 RepID=UPI002FC6002C